MNKWMLLVCLMITLSMNVFGLVTEELTATFNKVGNCSNMAENGSIMFNDSRTTQIVISNGDEDLVQYTIGCDGVVEAENLSGKCSGDNCIETYEFPSYNKASEEHDFKSTFDSEELVCEEVTEDSSLTVLKNLSFCYNATLAISKDFQAYYDDSQLLGEYRGRVTQAEASFADCEKARTSLTSERESLNDEAKTCDSQLSSCNAQNGACSDQKAALTAEKEDLKKQAGERIMYAIVAAIVAGGGMYLHFTGGRRNPDKTYDEQEFPRNENY